MLDQDTVPVGRHKWLVENNVCNEGKSSSEILLISGCKEDQFTCDDGKCVDISQRCNNIEVGTSNDVTKCGYNFHRKNCNHSFQDCDDVSDEKNCRTIFIDPEKYLKSKPPPSIESGSKLSIELR